MPAAYRIAGVWGKCPCRPGGNTGLRRTVADHVHGEIEPVWQHADVKPNLSGSGTADGLGPLAFFLLKFV
jgi:hypothetical protein